MRTGYLIPEKNYQFLDADVGCGQGPDVSGPLRSASRATGELMNMGVIDLIVCAHDARDAAHRLTVPVSRGRRRARIRSGGARDE